MARHALAVAALAIPWRTVVAQVTVTPQNGTATATSNTTGNTVTFTVHNLATFGNSLQIACFRGGLVTACSANYSSVTLPYDYSLPVTVTYTTGGGGSGQVGLSVYEYWDGGFYTGQYNVTVTGPPPAGPPAVDVSMNKGTLIAREQCLTIAAGAGAAYQCGDLRLSYPLPSVVTLNKTRTPTLVYNSQHARPTPIISANVSPGSPGSLAPTRVTATLQVNGATRATAELPASEWANGETRRVALSFDGVDLPTGVYPYSLEVDFWYNTSRMPTTVNGQLAIVNRSNSPFGPGWWLAGLEQVIRLASGSLLWIGGDGSTRQYDSTASGVYLAPTMVRPDTITASGGTWTRHLANGVTVHFNSAGLHDETLDVFNHATEFTYDACQRLKYIGIAPYLSGLAYNLTYTSTACSGTLASIMVPTTGPDRTIVFNDGPSSRAVYMQNTTLDTLVFEHTNASFPQRITARVDRRGTRTSFGFDGYGLLTSSTVDMRGTTANIVVTFNPAESKAVSAALRTDSVYTTLDGARTDTIDITKFWVNRFGAPDKIVDAYGATTTIAREYASSPGFVSKVVRPNGFTTIAVPTPRGNISYTQELGPLGGSLNGQTNYEWDPKWDKPTKITKTIGVGSWEVTEFAYDPTNGNRLWQQTGGASRRVNFSYNTDGLLSATQWPSGARESIDYNVAGVAIGVSSPSGMYTHINNDVLGRPVTVVKPLDRAGMYASIDSTEYDLLGRVTRTAQWGPAMNGAPAQSLIVRNFYDPNGNLDSLQRISVPSRGIDTLTTRWTNDFANRRTVETGPDGRSDVTVYDPASNATQQTTRRGDVLTMKYDRLNRLVQRVVPSSHPYTSMNRGIAAKRSQGYDQTEDGPYPRYPLSTQSALVVAGYTETFRYDPTSGFLTEADNADAQISRTYFPNGAINTETQRIANVDGTFGSHVYALSYQYDLLGRVTTLTHPSQLTPRNSQGTVLGSTTQYAYDASTGFLNSVTDVLGKQFRAHYNNDGERDSLIAPSGIAESYSYDVDGNLANQYLTTAQLGQYPHPVSILRNDSFTYDAGGRLLTLNGTQGAKETLIASYSGLGQMVSSHATSQGNDPNASESFDSYETLTYDAFSNTFYSLTTGRFVESAGGTLTGYTGGTTSNNAKDYGYYDRTNAGRLHTQYYEADGRTDSYEYDEAGNTTFTTQTSLGSNGFMEDRASYFDAANHLRASDYRVLANGYGFTSAINVTFEEYRYDALGRRVWVRTRRWCANSGGYDFKCRMSTVRRTVWDGNQELYEIQQPGYNTSTATEMENDGIPGEQPVSTQQTNQNYWDNNPFYGTTAYTHAFGVDEPLSVTRMNYSDHLYQMSFTRWDPYTVIPHWNSRGQPTNGSFGDGGRAWCLSATHCVNLRWPAGWFAYTRSAYTPYSWHGTLLEDKKDGAATFYRRNRVYDASTGRFTQEDPIGLAGGLNAYGFAAGDPVSYSDPFGLCPITPDDPTPCPVGNSDMSAAFRIAAGRLKPVQPVLEAAGNAEMAFMPLGELSEASSVLQGARLAEHLRQWEKYGEAGIRELENGVVRYYGEITSAEKKGEMVGRRLVREWNPSTGATRTWHETIDANGTVRIVRPQTTGEKVHFYFDALGKYLGKW